MHDNPPKTRGQKLGAVSKVALTSWHLEHAELGLEFFQVSSHSFHPHHRFGK